MHLGISLDKDFENVFMKLKHEYSEMIKIEGLSNEQLDPMRFFKAFLKSNNVANVSIDDNSNVNTQNMPTLLDESRKPLLKLMSFNKIFIEMKELFGLDIATEYFERQIKGDIFQHDSALTSYQHYCYAYSLKSIAENGLFFIKEMKANAPQHLDTFNSHYLEFCAFATNMQSGSVGTPDYLLWSYYFWNKDVESGYIPEDKKEVIRNQEFQKVIYSLNQPWMKISQSAYTNWSVMDRLYYEGLFGDLIFPNGEFAIDHMENFMEYQKRFLDFIRKERAKKSFTFPVLSLSCIFRENEFKDEDMVKYVVRHNMKWADINIYKSDNPDALSSCCRAEFNSKDIVKDKKLEGNFNSIGGSDLNIGSSKVVTINFPRIGYLSKGDFNKAKKLIKDNVMLIQKFHKAHRDILKKNVDRGLLPLFDYGLVSFDKLFATIGISGFEEYIDFMGGLDKNEIGEVKYNSIGEKISKETLEFINKLGENTVNEYGFTQNAEQIPGESANIKMLKKDRILFGDNYLSKKLTLSNQWLSLSSNCDINERIRMSGLLDNITSGGAILHANLGESWSTFDEAWNFNLNMAKFGVKYWSEIRKFHYCENDHNFFGELCPVCGGKAKGDIVKIVGYMTKNEYYKSERKEELKNRIFY